MKNIRLTNKDIDDNLKYKDIIRISDYVSAQVKLTFKCLTCSHIFENMARSVCNRGRGCPKCSKKLKLTNEEIDLRLLDRPIKRIGNYINLKTKLEFECLDVSCKYSWFAYPSNVLHHGNSCTKCGGTKKSTNEEIDIQLQNYKIKRLDNYINSKTKINFQCLNCENIWLTTTQNILLSNCGCPKCFTIRSNAEMNWLNSLNINSLVRNRKLKVGDINVIPDGFDPVTNTIYEFYGDYWHGNPKVFDHKKINTIVNKTFGELYFNTLKREHFMKMAGYNVLSIWESDYNKFLKGINV